MFYRGLTADEMLDAFEYRVAVYHALENVSAGCLNGYISLGGTIFLSSLFYVDVRSVDPIYPRYPNRNILS